MSNSESNRFIVQVFVGALSLHYEALSVEASKQTTSEEIVVCIVERLKLKDSPSCYELAEVVGDGSGQECKERRLGSTESPVQLMLLWPKSTDRQDEHYRFYLREKLTDASWNDSFSMDPDLIRDYLFKFLHQPKDREYPDLCQLPDLNEQTLLENLRARFQAGHIYTYVGTILIALNPFKFHPIYNPKYVKLYQNCRLGSELPPHIFAVADSAYHSMLKEKRNQCVVISGESGSGKTESTNFLLHHLTALSQKGSHGSGVEQTILSAGPVLEAFGNAKTAHNNNSSRFGKFIQVNYKENGMVHGAVVQKYLLEKSRICSQARNERNYHVFYYLLAGATDAERSQLHLLRVQDYNYLNQSGCFALDNVDEKYEFSRLKQSMEMVGFNIEKQRRLFSVLSAVLLLGNVEFQPRKVTYHHDEAVGVCNPEIVHLISDLLRVKQETLLAALCTKRAKASGETLIINYRMREAAAGRDAMAKCLYGALFDWIVLQLNHALLSKKDTLQYHQGHSIGVLDIFGFEDFGHCNSFEQLCINYANEHLQFYFNQHVFKYEQEEYRKEGIKWSDIDFMDNTGCLQLFEAKPLGLLCILDDQCNFPGATNETLVQKFNSVHKENAWYEMPPRREAAFTIRHFAGRVKYQVVDMREKNLDLMRQDIVGVLKNSSMAFVRELVGADPVAVFRWAIVRAFFRGYFAFHEAGRRHRQDRAEGSKTSILQQRFRHQSANESLVSRRKSPISPRPQHTPSPQHRRLSSRSGEKEQGGDEVRMKLMLFEGANRAMVMEKANQIVMKNKSFRPRERGKKGLKNLQSVKTLAGRTQSFGAVGKRKQPLTVTAQFQLSLHSLMDTLNMANPFFIRCIKSNGHKISNKFDEDTVQRQLRYTGMLETVRIRQAGYNVRLSYDEFIQIYRILLVKGLLSSQNDVKTFLSTLNLNRDNYQLGASKIFLRETEKVKLDYRLHQQIMAAIVTMQRWFRVCLERRKFLRLKEAAVVLQSAWRCVLAQKVVSQMRERINAAITIQAAFRRYSVQRWYLNLRTTVVTIQSRIRGTLVRRKVKQMLARRSSNDSASSNKEYSDIGRELDYPLRPARSNQEVRAVIAVGDPNAIAPRKKKLSQRRSHEDRSASIGLVEPKRKGSCDSLASQKSGDSSGLPVKDTLSKAKKQLQALLRGGKKSEKWEQVLQTAHSDGELDESSQNGGYEPWYQERNLSRTEDVEREFKSDESLDSSQLKKDLKKQHSMGDELRGDLWQSRREIQRHQLLRRGPTSPLDPMAPTRIARKARRSPKSESQSLDIAEPTNTSRISEVPVLSVSAPSREESAAIARTSSEPMRPRDQPSEKENVWIPGTCEDTTFKRTTSDPVRSSYEPPKRPLDPAIKYTENERRYSGVEHSSDLEWNNDQRTMFTICGHRFRKVSRFSKQDRCVFCDKSMDPIVTQGHKCSDCKLLFHTKCIQNGGVLQMPCQRKNRKTVRAPYEGKAQATSKFSLTGTSQFTDSTNKIISDVTELRKMQGFIADKIFKMESEGNQQRNSEVDRVFRQALREFKDNLVATYSIANRQGDSLNIKYKDLISNFMQVMRTVCSSEHPQDFSSVTMGVNAFRGFMNEFMAEQQHQAEKPRDKKRKKEKKRGKPEENINFQGHTFLLTIINIPTACEVCSSFFMWPIERSLVCQNCKVTCHKKCYTKVAGDCRVSHELNSDRRVFGVPLQRLASNGKVPLVVDQLITTIEMHGLYTEGIYRKSGVNSKVKELKARMELSNVEPVRFEDYQVHVLASVLKSFFREMPEPLLTFDCYEDFLRATVLTDPNDRISTLFAILKKLPKPNFDLMERLIFHLARVASQEESNRMSASALAIVFAPCILRTSKQMPAQDSLHDIGKQTQCIETIISEQLRKVRSTLADIDTLDTACHTASHRLSSLRSSKIFSPDEFHGGNLAAQNAEQADDDEEALLVDHIQEIEKEKALLTSTLPSLTRTTSDDDLLSTDMDDGSLDDNYCASRAGQDDPIMV